MPLYKFKIEGDIWLSINGHKAYKRGEKPLFLFADGLELMPTTYHYIVKKVGGVETRELVMFYKRV